MNTQVAQQIRYVQPQVIAESQAKVQDLLARAGSDADFRARLLREPRAAMGEFLGIDCSTLDVRFVENAGDATFVLPPLVDANAQLSDADLEAVSGGSEPITALCVVSVAGAVLGLAAAIYSAYDSGQQDAQKTSCTAQ